ncbi:hypothetical protein BJX96DRAFT_178839, partial [Aspergillus floccosus]
MTVDAQATSGPEESNATSLPRNINLGLNRTYAADWSVQDALRELYQNWKDAILQTSRISLPEFLPRVSVTNNETTITVEERPWQAPDGRWQRPPTQKVLGYIRYDHIKGSAEFANFSSRLDPECLEMGHTTKRGDHRLAGGHGEGLKIAALVLSRENHHVKVVTNGTYWNFGFNGPSKTNFYCRLTAAKGRGESGGPSSTATLS